MQYMTLKSKRFELRGGESLLSNFFVGVGTGLIFVFAII